MSDESLRRFMDGRLVGLRNDRYSWWVHWRELADNYLPRRYQWLVTPNKANRGSPINGTIIDSTGVVAARTCASGMMSGITSPTRPWFKLKLNGVDSVDSSNPISVWLAECERRMMRVFAESNFYNAIAVVYHDLVVFGSACMLVYEDFDDVIRCFNPCLGEFFLGNSDKMQVNCVFREFVLTASQMVEKFGIEACSNEVKQLYEDASGSGRSKEVKVRHGILPNTDSSQSGIAKRFPFFECYWEAATADQTKILSKRGFHEFPALCPRWDLVSNDAYGRSPAMDALGDVKQLQQEQKRKAQAIDKMVNPPLIADVQLKNQPASLLPGAITYVSGTSQVGMKPVFSVMPPVQEMMLDIEKVQERIKTIFFNDLFMMISQLQTVRTATEIDARREEKLVMLGPVLERFQNEALDPAVERTFNVMRRAGLLPPAPPEIQGEYVDIEYVSMLAEAQRAVGTSSLERLAAQAGNLAAVDPTVLDKIDFDQFLSVYGGLLSIDPRVIRDDEAVAKVRAERAKAQQQQQALAMTDPAVKGAQVLSKTDVGGGQNALQAMMGVGGVQ